MQAKNSTFAYESNGWFFIHDFLLVLNLLKILGLDLLFLEIDIFRRSDFRMRRSCLDPRQVYQSSQVQECHANRADHVQLQLQKIIKFITLQNFPTSKLTSKVFVILAKN